MTLIISLNAITWLNRFDFEVRSENELRFRLGATVPCTAFGSFKGGGRAFYNYMTKGPGFFAHIDWAFDTIHAWNWPGLKVFLKDMLDAADDDAGRCEISITLYGIDLGWPEKWRPLLLEVLEAIGPNRPSVRFIFLAGEWTYINKMPPTFDVLKSEFIQARDIVSSYGYALGWQAEWKYWTNVPTYLRSEVMKLGPRTYVAQISRDPDPIKGANETYYVASLRVSPTDVFMNAFTMWDKAANIPNVPPYYICYEKFEAYFRAASEIFDSTNGAYPQSLTFDVLPETFSSSCPFLKWWTELCEKYNVRTYQSPPVQIKEPTNLQPPSPFPPYPVLIHWTTSQRSFPPFYVQAGGDFSGDLFAKEIHNNRPPSSKEVEVYLIKQDLRSGSYFKPDHPVTREEWLNKKTYLGKATLGSDGWAYDKSFKAPLEPGRYVVELRLPHSSTEMEAWSDLGPPFFILVAEKTHNVEVRSNVRVQLTFGPSEYGPPWPEVNSQRWVSTTELVRGAVCEGSWTFIVPSEAKDSEGKTWKFSNWEDGSVSPKRSIFIDRDMLLEVYYSELDTGDSKIPSSILCSVSPSEQFKGNVIKISGSITPSVCGAPVTLTYITPNGSSFIHSLTTWSSGSYSENYCPQNFGTYYVQASWSGNEKYKGASSAWIPFSVIKRSSSITLSLSSDSIALGDSLGISGALSPPISNAVIMLSYRARGGSWVELTNLTADQKGWFSYLWIDTPLKAGTYEVKASCLGTDDYDGSFGSVSFSIVEGEKPLEPDFSISVDSPYKVLVIGESEQKITVSLLSKQGFFSDIKLSLSGVPNGVVTRLSPSTLTLLSNGRGNAIIGLYAGWSSSPGNYVLHLVASSEEIERYMDIKLKVVLPAPQFTVSINPRIITMPTLSGYNATLVVGISSMSNYTIEPSLSINGIPNGIEVELDEEVLTIPKLASAYTNLTLRTSAIPPTQGNYYFFLECSYNDIVVKKEITLILVDKIQIFLRANLTPTSVHYGEHILLKGTTSLQHPYKVSIVVVSQNGTQVNTATIKTNNSGEFALSMLILLTEGEYKLKVSCEEDDSHLGSTLNLTLNVEKADIIIELWSNATKVNTKETVLLKGIVKTTSGKPVQNSNVTIVISGTMGVQLIFLKTDEKGTYMVHICGLGPSKYNITSIINESDFYKFAISEQIKLEVYDSNILNPSNNIMSILAGMALTNLFLAIVSIARKSGK